MNQSYLSSVTKQFLYYKILAEKAIDQLSDEQLTYKFNEDSNSVAIIVKHIIGNMLSRFTNFLKEDGEKQWRERDLEFIEPHNDRNAMMDEWHTAWTCLFDVLDSLSASDLETLVYIRNEGHTVTEALNRQLSHYTYHVGQIVYIAKTLKGNDWKSLSIPKGKTKEYNKSKFEKDKGKRHYTDGLI